MRVRLHNIGPLHEADVEFGPLTVLVGPNGSGKTTFTSVSYALLRAHAYAMRIALGALENPFDFESERKPNPALGREIVDEWQGAFTRRLGFELRRCCSPDLSMLARARRGGKNAAPRIEMAASSWSMVFRLSGDDLWLETEHECYRRPKLRLPRKGTPLEARRALRKTLLDDVPRKGVYFPAGRSALVQTHSALNSLMAAALSGGYFEDATIGSIPGVTADFMQLVAQLSVKRRGKGLPGVARKLERNLLHGRVRIDESSGGKEILFRPEGHDDEWPIENVATSVAELSSLALYLRNLARPGDAIVIDEPESHLHAESQVVLATALAELAYRLPPVIVATHSEFLVSAFSNLLLEQSRTGKQKDQRPIALSVHEFSFRKDDHGLGVDVHLIDVKPTEGFEIKQISAVSDRVFGDSVTLYNRLHSPES